MATGADQVRFKCQMCGQLMSAPAAAAGRRVVCPACDGLNVVPASAARAVAPVAPQRHEAAGGAVAAASAAAPLTRVCSRCGETIRLDLQYAGKPAKCTRCWATLPPEAGEVVEEMEYADRPHPFARAAGWGISLLLHLLLILGMTGATWLSGLGTGSGEAEVGIGAGSESEDARLDTGAPSPVEIASPDTPVTMPSETATEPTEEVRELGVATETSPAEAVVGLDLGAGASGGFTALAGAVGSVGGGGGAAGGDWGSLIRQLRAHGLDIVLVFDSTGSMAGEIEEVKTKILGMGRALHKLVPGARIGVCTYRDTGDEYVVKGLPLTNDIRKVSEYTQPIRASGGGDAPEQVQQALAWAVENNPFRKGARKVILLFGDAPPHPQDVDTAIGIARRFRENQKGIVSTVVCHGAVVPEFAQIAKAGGGEAFDIADHRLIMERLMVLVFGSRHEANVRKAIEEMERGL